MASVMVPCGNIGDVDGGSDAVVERAFEPKPPPPPDMDESESHAPEAKPPPPPFAGDSAARSTSVPPLAVVASRSRRSRSTVRAA